MALRRMTLKQRFYRAIGYLQCDCGYKTRSPSAMVAHGMKKHFMPGLIEGIEKGSKERIDTTERR